jgi:uncharacterized membrane protein
MNKNRIEAFSDGVFAIAMTLLVFNITLPAHEGAITNAQLWQELLTLWPLITSFALSFLVLAVFWVNHNFFFNIFVKEVDRYINLMNLFYLMFVVFVPFSAHLFGTYPYNEPAALVYGLNIFAIIIIQRLMNRHMRKNDHLAHELESRLKKQARIRTNLTTYSYLFGIICSFVYIPASIFFYLFPIAFNIIPGTLNLAERIFRFELT